MYLMRLAEQEIVIFSFHLSADVLRVADGPYVRIADRSFESNRMKA